MIQSPSKNTANLLTLPFDDLPSPSDDLPSSRPLPSQGISPNSNIGVNSKTTSSISDDKNNSSTQLYATITRSTASDTLKSIVKDDITSAATTSAIDENVNVLVNNKNTLTLSNTTVSTALLPTSTASDNQAGNELPLFI